MVVELSRMEEVEAAQQLYLYLYVLTAVTFGYVCNIFFDIR